MPTTSDTPAALLAALNDTDPTRPRLTWYDDGPGPTQGERIELSGKVLATWTAKAANLLQEELDAGPDSVVGVDLPTHWRAAYWLFAIWSVGAHAVVGPAADILAREGVQALVTDHLSDLGDVGDLHATSALVAVSRPALARSWTGAEPLPEAPPGGVVIDEAAELAGYGDRFAPWGRIDGGGAALTVIGRDAGRSARWTYDEVLPAARREAARLSGAAEGGPVRVLTSAGPSAVVSHWLPAWTLDGSLVLTRGEIEPAQRATRIAAERVTDQL